MNTCLFCGRVIPEGGLICSRCDADYDNTSFSTIKTSILLNKITDVTDFVNLVSKCSSDVVAHSHHYSVNAKSMMGLFSLDLTKPLEVEFYGDIPYEVKEGMKKFIVN